MASGEALAGGVLPMPGRGPSAQFRRNKIKGGGLQPQLKYLAGAASQDAAA